MRRLFLFGIAAILAAGLGFDVPPVAAQQQGPVYCSQMAVSGTGFTTKAQIIPAPATGTARILVCGFIVSSAATSVITFQYGTATNCATGSTAIGPTIQLAATSTFTEDATFFHGFAVPNPNALCATATSAANMVVYYTLQ